MAEEIKKADPEERRGEKLPIDAKLLADSIISLNIARRSVSLYPGDHPIARESLENAYSSLNKLFELRGSITLGVARDVLMIDDYVLDKKNPVFREFARELHNRGIAALTFMSGLTLEDLLNLNEIMMDKAAVDEKAMAVLAEKKGLKNIRLIPLDLSKFVFREDGIREDGGDAEIWENYIYGMIEGKLSDTDINAVILNVPPKDIASFINDRMPDGPESETYDRVITSYLKSKDRTGVNKELLNRFISLVNNLSPDLKQRFLDKSMSHPSMSHEAADRLLAELSPEEIERMMNIFSKSNAVIPESIRNLMDKLRDTKSFGGFFDFRIDNKTILDDIEIDEKIVQLFQDDHFRAFVPEAYKMELQKMLEGSPTEMPVIMAESAKELDDESVDRKFSELSLELLAVGFISREEYLNLLNAVTEMANSFLESGRFFEISEIYNTIYSEALAGNFRDEASSMIQYLFHSEEFIKKFVSSVTLWGRHNREGVFRLVNVQKQHILDPLLDALSEEIDAPIRKFLLQLLVDLRSDVIPAAIKRLEDKRWYVTRNMIYLIREAGGVKYVKHIRPFAKSSNKKICMEAVKTLVQFGTPDSFSYIKLYLKGDDEEFREQTVKLAAKYRIKEAVPYIINMLDSKDFLGTESYYRITLVKALCEIGDPRALQTLMRLYNSGTLMYRGTLKELKTEIFRGLHKFRTEDIKPFIRIGLHSKNAEIRSISEILNEGRTTRDGV